MNRGQAPHKQNSIMKNFKKNALKAIENYYELTKSDLKLIFEGSMTNVNTWRYLVYNRKKTNTYLLIWSYNNNITYGDIEIFYSFPTMKQRLKECI